MKRVCIPARAVGHRRHRPGRVEENAGGENLGNGPPEAGARRSRRTGLVRDFPRVGPPPDLCRFQPKRWEPSFLCRSFHLFGRDDISQDAFVHFAALIEPLDHVVPIVGIPGIEVLIGACPTGPAY